MLAFDDDVELVGWFWITKCFLNYLHSLTTWLKAFMKNFMYKDLSKRSGLFMWGSSITWGLRLPSDVLLVEIIDLSFSRLEISFDCEYEDVWSVGGLMGF